MQNVWICPENDARKMFSQNPGGVVRYAIAQTNQQQQQEKYLHMCVMMNVSTSIRYYYYSH